MPVSPRSLSGFCKDLNGSAFLGPSLESEFALMRMELLQKVEMLRTELRDTLAKLQFASTVSLPPELQVGSIDEGTGSFGEFSPRAKLVSPPAVESVVITEMPELHEPCEEPCGLQESVVNTEMPELHEPCEEPCGLQEPIQELDFDESGVVDSVAPLSPESIGSEVSVGGVVATPVSPLCDEVGSLEPLAVDMTPSPPPSLSYELASSVDLFDREGFLARMDEAVFAKKLGRLLASLEAASPGSGKAIACLIAEEASAGIIKKVRRALRRIGKKGGDFGKALATA